MTSIDEVGRAGGSRKRLARRFILIGGPVALVLLTGAAVYPVARGWTDTPAGAMRRARSAVTDARLADAERLAPGLFAGAERSLAAGVSETVRQEGRFLSLRRFDLARREFAAAESLGALARRAAADSASAERLDASAAVSEAEDILSRADACGEALRRKGRGHYRAAQLLLDEARSLLAADRPREARAAAIESMEEAARACRQAAEVAARFLDHESVETWKRWITETVEESRKKGGAAVVVIKEKNELRLYQKGKLAKRYSADLGLNRLQTKQRAGDRATPEGRYRITVKKGPGSSSYYMALLLDYPNGADRARFKRAKEAGLIPAGASVGGDIEIHGEGGRGDDWTRGCIALSNEDIRDLFGRVAVGTPVTIVAGDGDGGAYSSLARRIIEVERGTPRR